MTRIKSLNFIEFSCGNNGTFRTRFSPEKKSNHKIMAKMREKKCIIGDLVFARTLISMQRNRSTGILMPSHGILIPKKNIDSNCWNENISTRELPIRIIYSRGGIFLQLSPLQAPTYSRERIFLQSSRLQELHGWKNDFSLHLRELPRNLNQQE